MRKHITALVLLIAVLMLPPVAQARKWPTPPGWWMNSKDMVAVRRCESSNGTSSTNLYGMIDAWPEVGGAGGKYGAWHASRAEQHYRAWLFWRRHGCHAGWGVWDGCC